MYEIESLKNGIKKCEENIEMIEDKIDKELERKDEYSSAAIMENPIYEKEKIKQEMANIDLNIRSMREVIKLDKKKIGEYKIHLTNAETILKQHGENPDNY